MTREEVEKIRYEKKVKKALKCLRFRKLKNFLFWLTGVIVMPAVLVLSMFIGLKIVPIKTYTGGLEQEYVSEEIANQSFLDVILNLNKYGVSDIPGVKDLVLEAINSSGIDEFITINDEKLDAVRFSYDKESGKEILTEVLDCISINPSVIGDASTISMLNEYEEVLGDERPEVDEYGNLADENANPKLYYYQVTQTGGGNAPLSAGGDENVQSYKYARAFNDDGTAVEGVTYQTKLYYPAIKDVPIMDLTGMIDEMIARVDVGEVLEVAFKETLEKGDNQLLTTLIDALSNKTINDLDNIPTDLLSAFTLTKILGGKDKAQVILADFASLGVFTWGEEVDVSEFYDKLDDNKIKADEDGKLMLNPALYYYFNGEEYKRVFNDDGVKYDTSPALFEGTSIYYANLLDISIADLLKVAGDAFGNLPAIDLINTLGGATITSNELIGKVLGDKTISQLGDLGDIYLYWVLPYDANNEICKVILQSFPKLSEQFDDDKTAYESITITMLSESGLDFNAISLSSFIDSNTLDMICDAINQYRLSEDYKTENGATGTQISSDKVTVGDIADFKPDYIALSLVASDIEDNIKNIICQLVGQEIGQEDFDKILVKDLSKASVENIKLNTVLPYYDDSDANKTIDNRALYKILLEASGTSLEGKTNKEIEKLALALEISALSDFDIKNITLGTAMPGANPTLKTLVEQITNSPKNSFNSITIADLSGEITVDNITLSTVLGEYGAEGKNNVTLYNILLEASGASEITAQKANELKMSVLNDFDLNEVSLSTALSGSQSASDNVILNALMINDVKLGNIDTAINDLSLYEIFGKDCFTTDESQKVEDEYSNCMFELVKGHPVYDKNGVAVQDEQGNVKTCDAYVHIDTVRADELRSLGEKVYYLHKNDGIWLLMCFEFGHIDKDITHVDYGRPNEYYISDNTLGSLMKTNEGGDNFMSDALTEATLRQLMDAGMVKFESESLYAKTLSDIIDILDDLAEKGMLPEVIG